MEAKNEFMQIYKENIHREGADKLLEWLERSDMFTAPASTQYHLSCAGGLCQHSVNVYKQLYTIYEAEYGAPQNDEVRESLAIIALLHDVCKINFYKPVLVMLKTKRASGKACRATRLTISFRMGMAKNLSTLLTDLCALRAMKLWQFDGIWAHGMMQCGVGVGHMGKLPANTRSSFFCM